MNRILAAIDRMQAQVESKNLPADKLAAISKSLDIELMEYAAFQEHKSLAFASGKLSLDEAQSIFGFLGASTEHFNRQPLAVKAVLTKLFAELLSAKVRKAA